MTDALLWATVFTWGYNINCSIIGRNGARNLMEMAKADPQYERAGQLGRYVGRRALPSPLSRARSDDLFAVAGRVRALPSKALTVACGGAHTACIAGSAAAAALCCQLIAARFQSTACTCGASTTKVAARSDLVGSAAIHRQLRRATGLLLQRRLDALGATPHFDAQGSSRRRVGVVLVEARVAGDVCASGVRRAPHCGLDECDLCATNNELVSFSLQTWAKSTRGATTSPAK